MKTKARRIRPQTPMFAYVNILLVLALFYFATTTSFRDFEAPYVSLPSSLTPPSYVCYPAPINVFITSEKKVFFSCHVPHVRKELVNRFPRYYQPSLQELIMAAKAIDPHLHVYVHADQNLPYKLISNIFESIQDAEVNHFKLVTLLRTQVKFLSSIK